MDGTYWLGDEFGPFLLHVDRAGRLLTAPIPTPGVFAPENPNLGGGTPNLAGSRGYESLAISPNGRYLYPVLEGTVTGDLAGQLRMYEFDLTAGAYTGKRWTHAMESPGHSVADVVPVDADRFLFLERDGTSGDSAVFRPTTTSSSV